jgi:GAF domain-containing protein
MLIGDPFVRFYAGVPLRSVDGKHVGTLCVADRAARNMPDAPLELLTEFAALVERELQLVDVIDAQQRLLEIQTALAASREHMAEELAKAANYVRGLLPAPLAGAVEINW